MRKRLVANRRYTILPLAEGNGFSSIFLFVHFLWPVTIDLCQWLMSLSCLVWSLFPLTSFLLEEYLYLQSSPKILDVIAKIFRHKGYLGLSLSPVFNSDKSHQICIQSTGINIIAKLKVFSCTSSSHNTTFASAYTCNYTLFTMSKSGDYENKLNSLKMLKQAMDNGLITREQYNYKQQEFLNVVNFPPPTQCLPSIHHQDPNQQVAVVMMHMERELERSKMRGM